MCGNVLTAPSLGPRQSGDTIEERWNNLMDELDCQSRADNGVYLIPWSEHEAEDWQNPGETSFRP